MKYIILLGDGMADLPIDELGGKTPLEAAGTPNMDLIASRGIGGYVRTIPDGYPPGSDVSNLAIFGYDPDLYYTGRAPLEAASLGLNLSKGDIAFRCNMVNLSNISDNSTMVDFCADHISTEESSQLIDELNKHLGSDKIAFFTGVGYRHIMVWKQGIESMISTPPHDIIDKGTKQYLPHGKGAEFILKIMRESHEILVDHPVNIKRRKLDKKDANSIWLWGQGSAVEVPEFYEEHKINGGVISAVDLIKGIGVLAGLEVINVPGVTGYLDTNYAGKVDYAIDTLSKKDFVYLHVEAPDEAGHEGNLEAKIQAIEDFDSLVVGPILDKIKRFGKFKVLVLCDHPTPLSLKTHTSDPVPYALYPAESDNISTKFNESLVKTGTKNFDKGYELINFFLKS